MLCWYIFITLSRVLSVGVQWGLNECLTSSNGKKKKEKEKARLKESWIALPPPIFLSRSPPFFLPLLQSLGADRWSRCFLRLPGLRIVFEKLWEAANVSVLGATVLSGGLVLLGGRESMALHHDLHAPQQHMLNRAYTHTHTHTHRNTVEHSKINAVRATMIPLHYLHTGPPSCARLPHCPLHCFSMEVVITKTNISCTLCLQLPSTYPLFLSLFAVLPSDLPAFCQPVTQLKGYQCGWQHQRDSPRVCERCIMRLFGAQLMCNKGTVCYPRFGSVLWVKHALCHNNSEVLDVPLQCLLYCTLLV